MLAGDAQDVLGGGASSDRDINPIAAQGDGEALGEQLVVLDDQDSR